MKWSKIDILIDTDMLPTVSNFCCCFSLRVGVLIVGWFQVIAGLTGVAVLSYFLSNPGEFPDDKNLVYKKEVAIGYFIVYIFTFIFGCLLLTAVFKERARLMKPWIIVQIVKASFAFISVIFGFAYLWYNVFAGQNVAEIVEAMIYDLLEFGNLNILEQ